MCLKALLRSVQTADWVNNECQREVHYLHVDK